MTFLATVATAGGTFSGSMSNKVAVVAPREMRNWKIVKFCTMIYNASHLKNYILHQNELKRGKKSILARQFNVCSGPENLKMSRPKIKQINFMKKLFLYKVAPPELKISPIMYFVMYNSVVLSKILKIVVPLEQNFEETDFYSIKLVILIIIDICK